MRQYAARALLPAVLGLAVLVVWVTLPWIGVEASAGLGAAAGALLVWAAERLLPGPAGWRASWDALRLDLSFLGLSALLWPLFQAALSAGAWLGMEGAWPRGWPLPLQVGLGLLLLELVQYGTHRLLHWHPWLWRFHAPHHAPEALYLWAAVRNHPVDTLLTIALPAAPLGWLGAPPEVLAYGAALVGANAALQHASLNSPASAWDWLFATPGMHQRHHAREPHHAQYNFGGLLLVWDWLFGTRAPTLGQAPTLGIEGAAPPATFWGQVAEPFRRRASTDRT